MTTIQTAQPSKITFLNRLIDTRSAIAVTVGALLWLALFAGLRPLMLPDEGRYAGVAWEMAASGNWSVPLLDGLPFFHKPPLFYWISAFGLKLFGMSAWASRLPSILAGTATIGALYLFLRRYHSRQIAMLTVTILATQPFFFLGSQFANLDMLVAGMISLTVLAGADAILRLEDGRPWRKALTVAYVLAATGVLAKGLIGFVLPGGILFFWVLWRGSWRRLPSLFWPGAVFAFALIALPWFVRMQNLYPGFFDYFVIYHHFQRFAASGFNNQQPFWFYPPVILLLILPWSPWIARWFVPGARSAEASFALRSLMLIWLALVLLFFSMPKSKLIGYILPALPPLAYFIAEIFSGWLARSTNHARHWYGITLAAAAMVCIALTVGIDHYYKASSSPLAETARSAFKPDDQLVMINQYKYDLPFYLHATRPAWVVDEWDDPAIEKVDNWRKELFDASKFDTNRAHETLLTPARLQARLCQGKIDAFWILAGHRSREAVPWLDDVPPFAQDKQNFLWRLTPELIRQLPLCVEKPKAG